MRLQVDNLRATVLSARPEEHAALAQFFMELRDEMAENETRSLWSDETQSFPAGLLPLVEGEIPRLTVVDDRCIPLGNGTPFPAAAEDPLRDYQKEAVEAVRQNGRGILQMATGSGKTMVAAALILSEPCRWLFLVHTRVLQTQTRRAFAELGIPTWTADRDHGVLVTTYQGLWQMIQTAQTKDTAMKFLALVEGVIVDECHRAAAESPLEVLDNLPNAYYRVGLSATPLMREDKADAFTVGALGPVIFRAPAKEMQEKGVLSEGVVYFHAHQEGIETPRLASFAEVYRMGVSEAPKRNAKVLDLVERVPRPALLFVREKDHGRSLCEAVKARGLRATFISGDDNETTRETVLAALADGSLDVLVATVILQDGYDLPKLRAVVNASAGKAAIGAIQRLGRAMRRAEGKTEFEYHDIYDIGNRALERHSNLRITAYQEELGLRVEMVGVEQVQGTQEVEEENPFWEPSYFICGLITGLFLVLWAITKQALQIAPWTNYIVLVIVLAFFIAWKRLHRWVTT